MTAATPSLFCSTALAERIERVEAQLIAEVGEAARRRNPDAGGFVTAIAGGVACFAEPGSPFNKVAGLGFGDVPSQAALDQIEHAFAACGAHVQIELAHLAEPATGAVLTERGYRLVSFKNVLGLAVEGEPGRPCRPGSRSASPPMIEFQMWLDVVADGFAHPDVEGLPQHEEFPRDVIERAERDFTVAGVVRYVALRDGEIAGGASFAHRGRCRPNSPARRPRRLIAAAESRARCCPLGLRMPLPRVATSASSPRCRARSRRRMCSAGVSICSTPARYW